MATPYFDALPPELALEAQRIARKQALSDALLKQSLEPRSQQMVGGRVVRMSPLEGVGQLAAAYFGAKGQQEGDEAYANLGKKYNEGLSGAVRQYMNTRQGTPGSTEQIIDEQAAGGEGAPATITAPAIPGRPMDAIIQGMTSGYKPLQSLAQSELTQLGKNQMTTKDLLSLNDFDPKTRVVAGQLLNAGVPLQQVLAQLGPKKDIKSVADRLVDVSGDKPQTIGDFSTQMEKNSDGSTRIYNIDGDKFQKDLNSGKFFKMDNAPKVTVNNKTDVTVAGPKKGAEVLFSEGAKTVAQLGEQARGAKEVENKLAQMKSLEERGIYSNVTTGGVTFMVNLAESLNLPISAKQKASLGNTEAYNAVATEAWQKLVNQFGGNRGVTKEEAEQIKTILPLTRNSPEARAQLYTILGNAAQRVQAQFREANKAYLGAVQADDPSIWVNHFENTFLPNPPTNLSVDPKPRGTLRPYPGGQ